MMPYYDTPLGPIEVFAVSEFDMLENMPPGWYWWPCHPGCLPDGDAIGPFPSEADALEDATATEPEE